MKIQKIIYYINNKYQTQYNSEYVLNIFANNLVNQIISFNTKASGFKRYDFIKLIISNLSKEIIENINVKIFVLSNLKSIIKYSELFTNKKLFEIINHWIITDKTNLINQLDLICLEVYSNSINWNKNKILTEYLIDLELLNANNIEYQRIEELPKKYQNTAKLLVKFDINELLNTNIIQIQNFDINTSDSNYINNIITNFSFKQKEKDILVKEFVRIFSNKNIHMPNININIKEADLIKLFNLLDKKHIMDNKILIGLYSNGYIIALEYIVKNLFR